MTVKPVNTLALAGTSVTLQCRTDRDGSPGRIAWIRNPDTNSESIVGYGCRQYSAFPEYSVISSSVGQCDLVITASQALVTTYRCVDGSYPYKSADAELTVIGKSYVHAHYAITSKVFCYALAFGTGPWLS